MTYYIFAAIVIYLFMGNYFSSEFFIVSEPEEVSEWYLILLINFVFWIFWPVLWGLLGIDKLMGRISSS